MDHVSSTTTSLRPQNVEKLIDAALQGLKVSLWMRSLQLLCVSKWRTACSALLLTLSRESQMSMGGRCGAAVKPSLQVRTKVLQQLILQMKAKIKLLGLSVSLAC